MPELIFDEIPGENHEKCMTVISGIMLRLISKGILKNRSLS